MSVQNMSLSELAVIGEAINRVDFDHAFALYRDGSMIDADPYAPSATDDNYIPSRPLDIVLDSPEWEVVTQGMSGQYGYAGAVMHPSEFIGAPLARHLLEIVADHDASCQVFAVVEVRDCDGQYPDGDPLGWTIVRYIGKVA